MKPEDSEPNSLNREGALTVDAYNSFVLTRIKINRGGTWPSTPKFYTWFFFKPVLRVSNGSDAGFIFRKIGPYHLLQEILPQIIGALLVHEGLQSF